ncbi:MAG TPA: beta-propeller fold lactonase family protein [Bacteroidales bacterium]|nr:beta-propeller fold lactonase family protein [Bacteroidales bacterium]
MKFKKRYLAILFLLILAVISFPAHKWSREHVNYITATTDHPLNCASCHLYLKKNPVSEMLEPAYYSPINLACAGGKLFIVTQDRNMLLEADPSSGKITAKTEVGNHPHTVITDTENKYCYVSNQWSDNISVVDIASFKVVKTISTGNGPAGVALSKDGQYLYAVNSFGGDISVIDLVSGQEIKRLPAGNNPTGIQVSPDGKTVYVPSRRALIAPYGSTLKTELTVMNGEMQTIEKHREIESAYMMENAAFTPEGDLAIFTMIRPKNLVPSIQVERGFMMTHGIGVIDQGTGKVVQLLTDEPNQFYPDPFDVVITPDGRKAFVSSSGIDCVSVLSIDSIRHIIKNTPDHLLASFANNLGVSRHFVSSRIRTGANPKGMAVSPDGKFVYVAEMLDDRIAVIDADSEKIVRTIDLGGPGRVSVRRQGRQLLNNAGHTFQNQYSCYTCHPDTHEDGLVYNMASKDMGRNVTNTQSLRDIGETAPFKWNGKNQSIYKQDGMRFSTVLTRTEPFSYKELDAITAYIYSGISNPPDLLYNPDGALTSAQMRGKEIFERSADSKGYEIPAPNRCVTCHPAPFYTNRKIVDVGTLASSDDSILFDVPHLNNIFASAPYLHDGRAATLEEIWTIYGKTEQHGAVNDLNKTQLNDLIEYLKSLRDPVYETDKTEYSKASMFHK